MGCTKRHSTAMRIPSRNVGILKIACSYHSPIKGTIYDLFAYEGG